MSLKIDIDISKDSSGIFDIAVADNGDLVTTEGFDTALKMSIFCERRASSSEVQVSKFRRGWIGNLLSDIVNFEIGSKRWLFDQDRMTQETVNGVSDAINDGLQWLIEDNYLDAIDVTAANTLDTITVQVDLFRNGSRVDKQFFDAWRATGL